MKRIDFTNISLFGILVLVFVCSAVFRLTYNGVIQNSIISLLSPILISFGIAYFFEQIVSFFELRLKLWRGISILISFSLTIATLSFFITVIIPGIIDATQNLLNLISNINFENILNITFEIKFLEPFKDDILKSVLPIVQNITSFTGTFIINLLSSVQKITAGLISFIVTLSVAIYMLLEKYDLIARLSRLCNAYLTKSQVEYLIKVVNLSDKIFKAFIFGKFIDSVIIGLLTYFVLIIFGFKFAILIAFIVGVTNMIPYFGPFMGAIPAVLITAFAFPLEPIRILYMGLTILVIQQLDGNVIGPFILGDTVGVSSFWIIISVAAGGTLAGVLGMFLAVPVVVLLKTLLEEDIDRKLAEKGLEHIGVNKIKKKVIK